MDTSKIKENALKICENFNQANIGYGLQVCENARELADFYKTYDGITEFLYIAPEEEIEEAIKSGATFFGIYDKDKLAAVSKISPLQLPYPFFSVPKNMDEKKDYWGFSGLYVNKEYQGCHLSTNLIKASFSLAESSEAQGVYADFDYRNIKSMRTISKNFSFLGYTDGRNGAPEEATIYTTFFKDFSGSSIKDDSFEMKYEDIDCDSARETIDETMAKIGKSSSTFVEYGGGVNEIVCFDTPHEFVRTHIMLPIDVSQKNDEYLENLEEISQQ